MRGVNNLVYSTYRASRKVLVVWPSGKNSYFQTDKENLLEIIFKFLKLLARTKNGIVYKILFR